MITNKLYQDSKIKNILRERECDNYYSQICTFTPKIHNNSEPKMENFYVRLQDWLDKRKEKMIKLTDRSYGNFNKSRSKDRNDNVSNNKNPPRNVFIDLYEESHQLKINKEESIKRYHVELDQMASSRKATPQIEEIDMTLRLECFKSLFEVLDHDDDKTLVFNNDFKKNLESRLNKDILVIIEPIIEELQLNKLELNFEEFLLVIDHLYKIINVDEKRRLINWYLKNVKRDNSNRKRQYSYEPNFKPCITDNSTKIYSNSKRISKDVYKRNAELLETKRKFLKEKTEEKLKNEIKGNF